MSVMDTALRESLKTLRLSGRRDHVVRPTLGVPLPKESCRSGSGSTVTARGAPWGSPRTVNTVAHDEAWVYAAQM
ncbi:hypothetical protein ABT187_43885 [Streptomyces sp. NPDC001817]|uniref:hypothetical protein n=1 Tax=Streptomyces sp. NPDC001817 TaxID=3154398 RepID=UPI00332158A4